MTLTSYDTAISDLKNRVLEPSFFKLNANEFTVRLAETHEEIDKAQQLRYDIFYNERSAIADENTKLHQRDIDAYDAIADHLLVFHHDDKGEHVVGTYRLLRHNILPASYNLYTSQEYNIDAILKQDRTILELGRSCVAKPFRTRNVLKLLWEAIAQYVFNYDIDILLGCASFEKADYHLHKESLSYLHYYHAAPDSLLGYVTATPSTSMDLVPKDSLNVKTIMRDLPPLIKGYLRLGGVVGEGAYIDTQFDTTDILMIVNIDNVSSRYFNHYQRQQM